MAVSDKWSFAVLDPDGRVRGELISATGRQCSWYVDQAANAQFTLSGLDPMADQLNELTTDLALLLGSEPWFLGRMGPSSDDLNPDTGHNCQFGAVDYRGLLTTRRIIWPDFDLNFQGMDLSDVSWSLVDQSQHEAQGALGIEKGVFEETGVKFIEPSLTGFSTTNFPQLTYGDLIGQDIDTLSNCSTTEGLSPGFEWEVSSKLRFNLWVPQRGTDISDKIFLEYGGNVSQVNRNTDPSKFANALYVTGSWSSQTDPAETRRAYNVPSAFTSHSVTLGQNVIDLNVQQGQVGWQVLGVGIPYDDSNPTVIAKVYSQRSLPAIKTWDNSHVVGTDGLVVTFASPCGMDPGDAFQIQSSDNGVLDGTYYVTMSDVGKTVMTCSCFDISRLGSITVPSNGNVGFGTVPAQFEMQDSKSPPNPVYATISAKNTPIYLNRFVTAIAPGINYLTGRWEQTVSNTDIVNYSTVLKNFAQAQLVEMTDNFTPSYQCLLTPGWWTPDVCFVGDTVTLIINSGRLQVNARYRIVQIDLALPDDGDVPQVTLTLGNRLPNTRDRLANYHRRILSLEHR